MDMAIQYDIDQHLEEWKINGFTIFEDLIQNSLGFLSYQICSKYFRFNVKKNGIFAFWPA